VRLSVSHLQRIGYILGTLLIGISAYLVWNDRTSGVRSRRRSKPPVDELAHELQDAWSGYHNR
jgi:hypothetical protein